MNVKFPVPLGTYQMNLIDYSFKSTNQIGNDCESNEWGHFKIK